MKKTRKKANINIRILILTAFFSLLFMLLIGRTAYLQFVRGNELRQLALEQQTKENEITPRRGTIYDTNGKELAVSANVDTVVVDPKRIAEEGNAKQVVATLSEVLGVDKDKIYSSLEKSSRFEYIKKRISSEESAILRSYISGEDADGNSLPESVLEEHNLVGVSLISDTKRYYPYSNLAAQVLGNVGSDNQGLEGLEYEYDEYLKGSAGTLIKSDSAAGSPTFEYEEYYNAQAGCDIVLTLDETIQRIVETSLEEAYIENKAAGGGAAIVMDPHTGAILAMASVPTYNLNEPLTITDPETLSKLEKLDGDEYNAAYVEATSKIKRNKPSVDVYEPGSTFKLITCAMALEENVTTLEENYLCNGYLEAGGWNISCWKPAGHGPQTFMTGMVNSCNPVLMNVGLKIGREKFVNNFKRFGFRETTGIDYPGEAIGAFHQEDAFTDLDLMISSFGQSFQVTPLQMITAISSLVNGGTLFKPYLVKEIKSADGQVLKSFTPQQIRQTVSKQTSEKMKTVLETVVTQSGSTAAVKGYRVGGKSGTSEKQPRGSNKYIGSFVGVAPVDDPKVIVLVLLDEPMGENYYGGVITAPVAGKIISETLQYYGIEPQYTQKESEDLSAVVPDVISMSVTEAKQVITNYGLKYVIQGSGDQVISQEPSSGTAVKNGSSVTLHTNLAGGEEYVKVPDIFSLNIEQANEIIVNSGLKLKITKNSGSVVTGQSPAAGELAEKGSTVSVTTGNES
ncbi:MAG: PASTA domain-containing protein [Clostridia bacterium]|nr:PASTA domain-containing protein [Clostridia bacterium]